MFITLISHLHSGHIQCYLKYMDRIVDRFYIIENDCEDDDGEDDDAGDDDDVGDKDDVGDDDDAGDGK